MSVFETLGLKLGVDATAWRSMLDDMRARWGEFGTAAQRASTTASEGLDKVSENLDHLNGALELVKKAMEAFDKVSELAHFSAELENLKEHVPVERLQMMQEATEGAVAKTDLMRFSMKALTGDLRLTEAGLNVVLKAANTLGDEGFGETLEIANKLMDSLRKGSSRELHEFGIALKDTEDKQANLNAELKVFKDLAEKDVHVNEGLKQIERVQTAWKDLITDVKASLGDLVQQVGQAVAELLGLMPKSQENRDTEYLTSSAEAAARRAIGGKRIRSSTGSVTDQFTLSNDPSDYLAYQVAYFQGLAEYAGTLKRTKSWQGLASAVNDASNQPLTEGSLPSGGGPKGGGGMSWADTFKSGLDRPGSFVLGHQTLEGADVSDPNSMQLSTGNMASGLPSYTQDHGEDDSFFGRDSGGPSNLFGVSDFEKAKQMEDALKDRTTLLGGSFDSLSQGLSAAVDAAITGSDNIGKAFLKASATALKALAVESTVRAAFELAMGLGTAIFAPADAAKHFAAAAQFGITAALAGVGAAALGAAGGGFAGGGGGGGASTPAGNGAVSSGSGSTGPQAQQINVYIGDGFVGRADELGKQIADQVNGATKLGRARVNSTSQSVVTFKNG